MHDGAVSDDDVHLGPRITLRRPRIEDADAIFAATASAPTVTEYLSWTPHLDVEETRRVITELFNEVQMGYCMAARWGHGLMPEAVGMILQHLQQDSRLDRVTAAVHVANTRSARVLAKCGFTLMGTLPRYAVFPALGPEPQDCLLYVKAMR